jgi:hypothetical protein
MEEIILLDLLIGELVYAENFGAYTVMHLLTLMKYKNL